MEKLRRETKWHENSFFVGTDKVHGILKTDSLVGWMWTLLNKDKLKL